MNQPTGRPESTPKAFRPAVAARIGCACSILLLATLSGCVTDTGAPSRVAADQFKDLIVPSGLSLQQSRHESYSEQVGSWRVGHYVYRGSLRAQDAIAYVQQRAPQHGWKAEPPVALDDDNTSLRLVRPPHRIDYTFTRIGGYLQVIADYRTEYDSQ